VLRFWGEGVVKTGFLFNLFREDDWVADPEERKGENEAFFREVNERLERQAVTKPDIAERFQILCECPIEDCTLKLTVSFAEYESIRGDSRRFVVARGHVNPQFERIVGSTDSYEVVQKFGEAGATAAAEDPRSDI
jgi:hypothetical protein